MRHLCGTRYIARTRIDMKRFATVLNMEVPMIRGRCLRTTACVALFALAGLLCLTANAFAATTGTAAVGATIIAPLSITQAADLAFGTLGFGPGAGTAVVATNGGRTVTGSATPVPGNQHAASFAITGEGTNTYAITLPAVAIDINNGATGGMTVDTFVSSPDATGTLVAGADTLLVGATLHSTGSQEVGSYTGTFDVTVAYN